MDLLTKFSVTNQDNTEAITKLFASYLTEGEQVIVGYTHTRDKVVFTNKKIICLDVQGLTGKKKSYRFFPYSKITSFSIETAGGILDGDSDFKIYVSGVGLFEIKFAKRIDIQQLGSFLCSMIS